MGYGLIMNVVSVCGGQSLVVGVCGLFLVVGICG